MEIQRFFELLRRNLWLLVLIPVIAVSATYFLALDLPKEYRSDALISTGLADHSQRSIGSNQMDYFATNQQFENIIEFLKMRKNLNSLSFKLVLHDLENQNESFSEIPESITALGDTGRKAIIEEYKKFLIEGKIVTPEDNKKYKFFDYIQLMGYGESAISEKLEISRKDNSDFIKVEYLSNNPYLSVYVVNTVANDFINSYEERSNFNKNSSKELLDSLLKGKEASMNAKNNQIKNFQVQNSVIDLGGQAEQIFAQIGLKDALRATTVSQIQSLQGAIKGIEEKLKNKNSALVSSNANENTQIVTLRNQLQKANERYVQNNFKPEDARAIDSLQTTLSKLNAGNPSSSGSDPKILRQALIQQKLTMEIELDKAKSGLTATMNDLSQMRAQFNRMVPDNAGMKNFEREAEVATKEYLSALDMYNQNNVQGSTSAIRPQLAQVGVVNSPEPSKKAVFMGLAGIGSLGTCIFAFAIAFLLDRKVRTTDQLGLATHKRIIGQVNNIVPNNIDLKTVWEEDQSNKDYSLYKDLIRSLRFEIDVSLKSDFKQIIGVTSLFDQAGSSFISSSLAYSFAVTKKRVLLIGGDYVLDKPNEIKKIAHDQLFDSFIVKRELHTDEFITKLTTNAKNESLLEVYNEDILRTGFEELKKEFDVIIIDIQSLQKIHRAKEWLMFADKSIALYPAGAVVGPYEKELISFINKQDGFIGWVLNKTKSSDLGLMKMLQLN